MGQLVSLCGQKLHMLYPADEYAFFFFFFAFVCAGVA